MDDKELFEKMEALLQAIDWIEQKEQLAVYKIIEICLPEDNLGQ